MRVIAGNLGGRQFESPGGHRTHPMSDKIRGAIFNRLGDIEGLTVLDAFSGSGALAIEAVSRGAKHTTAIDIDANAHTAIVNNLKQLGINNIKVIRANVTRWSMKNPQAAFDIIFCDPPYDQTQIKVIQDLTRHVANKGLLVLSWPSSEPVPSLTSFECVSHKIYGDAQLAFYKHLTV